MDHANAREILDIDSECNLTFEIVKQKYRKSALKYHPDKNGGSDDANEKFKLVQESYEFLKKDLECSGDEGTANANANANTCTTDYTQLLRIFIESLGSSGTNTQFSSIISDIVTGVQKISLRLFEGLDKEKAVDIYIFLSKYKSILHISPDVLDKVREIILEKHTNHEIYILNPSLDDLLDSNIYKLSVENEIYFVPLWHDVVYFGKTSCSEIIVKCIPELPDHITIDENNALHVELRVPFTVSLLDCSMVSFNLGKQTFTVSVKLKKNQSIFIPDSGVVQIHEGDMYDEKVRRKAGIYVKILFF